MGLFLIRAILVLVLLIPVSIFGLYVYNGVTELAKKPKKQIISEAKGLVVSVLGLILWFILMLGSYYVLLPLLATILQIATPLIKEFEENAGKFWESVYRFYELFRYNQSHLK